MAFKIRKAVLPVAGLGTRFLPATKSTPKEMLPVVDKPLIQYAVEEAVAAGVEEIIFVTSSSKHSIENHFDHNFELESKLAQKGKKEMLELVHNIKPDSVSCVYVRQPAPLGLGHAVLCAKQLVGNEPFAVLLADDLIYTSSDQPNCLQQMIKVFDKTQGNVLAVEEVPLSDVSKYGIVKLSNAQLAKGEYQEMRGIIEKPQPKDAPSRFASIGRYILLPDVMDYLTTLAPGVSGEVQLVDGIAKSINEHQNVYGYYFDGKKYDCGSKLGYLKATVGFGLRHPETSADFKQFLNDLVNHAS